MKNKRFSLSILCNLTFTVLVPVVVAAQPTETQMRTPDGQPHISGPFTFRTLTPLQRPTALEGQAQLGVEEAAAFEASERTRLNRDLFDPAAGAPTAGYQPRASGGVLSYNTSSQNYYNSRFNTWSSS